MEQTQPDLIVIGASARAAAFSAARAGFAPYWIDQFGDSDLRAAFPGRCVPAGRYPEGIPELAAQAPDAPWIYTGALENHPDVLDRVEAMRPLLGNGRHVCEGVRDPWRLAACLRSAGIPFPDTPPAGSPAPDGGDWIAKPLRGAGGRGIHRLAPGARPGGGMYAQGLLRGPGCSAVYVADGRDAILIGVTRQLVGLAEFHAAPFAYCGSIGPVVPVGGERRRWEAIGEAVAAGFGLKGIFGVDAILGPDGVTPVEVNPRYTASVEVLERALELPAIALHVAAFAGGLMEPAVRGGGRYAGKCYLFAPRAREFAGIDPLPDARAATQCADVPETGTRIEAGAPIMTLLATAPSGEECMDMLSAHARRVYNRLGV